MDFISKLIDYNLRDILSKPEFESVSFINSPRIFESLDDIIKNNRRVLLYGDYDADGLCCNIVWKLAFALIGFTNYDLFQYGKRTHLLDTMAVEKAISEKYDYIIINDTASSENYKLELLDKAGVKSIVIDHHDTMNDYDDFPDSCVIVNSVIENRVIGEKKYVVSAGALSFLVLDYYLNKKGYDTSGMSCFALVSLYSDCIDMSNKINRSIYYKAMELKYGNLPSYISDFMNDYVSFTRRFIEFQWTPKINSVFRSENFYLLNNYIMKKGLGSFVANAEMIEDISNLHFNSIALVDKLTDIIEYRELDNFVIGNLSSVDSHVDVKKNKVYNYTGLVANRLTSRFGKPAIVYCNAGFSIKGSFRDTRCRDYLSIFRRFCDAAGHAPAFGISIGKYDFLDWIDSIKTVDRRFSIEAPPNRPITVEHSGDEPDTQMLLDMARYNEFSGSAIPIAILLKRFTADIREIRTPYSGYKYDWHGISIKSSVKLKPGVVYSMKPTLLKKVNLYVV